jgi:diguanylate cyclase (GGDEF)-like protein/PAS domain S-box-containing protein
VLLNDLGDRVVCSAGSSLPQGLHRAILAMKIGDEQRQLDSATWRHETAMAAALPTQSVGDQCKALAACHGLQGCWSTPVLGAGGRVLGSFAVYSHEPRKLRPVEHANIDRLLPLVDIAVATSKLVERLHVRDCFFDLSMEIYCIVDQASGRIAHANPTFCIVTGYSEEELASHDHLDFVHPHDRQAATDAVVSLASGERRERQFACRFRCKDDSYRWLVWKFATSPDGLIHAVGNDITVRRRIEDNATYSAEHDSVTGLTHYILLESSLYALLEDGATSVWVYFIGIDRFKMVNDSIGYVMGDDTLQKLALRLREAMGPNGEIARFTGDEFIAAVPGLSRPDALAFADRMRAAVAEPIEGLDYKLLLSASIGISHAPDHGNSPNDLVRRAEAAMRVAKREGRDGVREFSIAQMQEIENRLSLGGHLRDAIRLGEFQLHYQPQYGATGRTLTGFEALLRWTSPKIGNVSPARFIPIAEALGLMPEIGEWVLHTACKQARDWLDRGHRKFAIAVNVSAQQLQGPGLVAHVSAALLRYRLLPEVLDIELTESCLMESVSRVQQTLADLKALGTMLSLDDFGTGYSSLAYLKHFPIDKLKIDQSFVRGLPDAADDAAIAQTIVAMGHQLRMVVAAEGVETEAQAAFLTSIGCDELQGYGLGRPAAAEAAERFFAH